MSSIEQVVESVKAIDSGIGRIATKQQEFADRLLSLEQRASAPAGHGHSSSDVGSFGTAVAKAFKDNADQFNKGRTLTLCVKAAITSDQVGNRANIGPSAKPVSYASRLVSAIPTRPLLGVQSANYSRMTSPGNAAAVQSAEGAAKTLVQPVFAPITQNAITVAGYAQLTEQSLKTQGELASVVDGTLRNSVMNALDAVLVDGTAVAAWPFSGYEALATAFASAVYTALADAIVEGAATLRLAGYEPDVVVLNPTGFLAIALAKSTTGEYLSGQYMGVLPLMLHGMRVVFSSGIAANAALVIDSRFSEVLISDELNVTLAYNSDDFIKNQITARAEVAAIPIARDLSSMLLVTPKP